MNLLKINLQIIILTGMTGYLHLKYVGMYLPKQINIYKDAARKTTCGVLLVNLNIQFIKKQKQTTIEKFAKP